MRKREISLQHAGGLHPRSRRIPLQYQLPHSMMNQGGLKRRVRAFPWKYFVRRVERGGRVESLLLGRHHMKTDIPVFIWWRTTRPYILGSISLPICTSGSFSKACRTADQNARRVGKLPQLGGSSTSTVGSMPSTTQLTRSISSSL